MFKCYFNVFVGFSIQAAIYFEVVKGRCDGFERFSTTNFKHINSCVHANLVSRLYI